MMKTTVKAIANRTIVPLYETPNHLTALSDEVLYGMTVHVEEFFSDRWCYITTEYLYHGYVSSDDLLILPDQTETWQKSHKMRVHWAYADVLSEPKVQGYCMQEIPRGGLICVPDPVHSDNGWLQVILADGRTGYMKEHFLGEIKTTDNRTESDIRHDVIETAMSYLGTQYRWGGKTPLGIDCSGLTSVSYLINGIFTFRDAKIMDGFPVKEIDFEDRKPGDLLYFKGHIALLTEKNRYIHSTGRSGSDGVVLNSLNPSDPDYREDLAEGILAVGSVFPLV